MLSMLLSVIISFNCLISPLMVANEVDTISVTNYVRTQMQIRGYDYTQIEKMTPLYSDENVVIGYCYDFDNAYLITNSSGDVVEHSPTANSPYFNSDNTAFYGGPLEYYNVVDNGFVNIATDELVNDFNSVDISSLLSVNYTSMSMDDNISFSSSGYDVKTHRVSGTLRTLDYNEENGCGPLAFAIMLFYYYDYISASYIGPFFENYPEALYDMLLSLYFTPDTNGSYGTSYQSLSSAMNEYFEDRNLSTTAVANNSIKFHTMVNYWIQSNRPVIVGLYDNDGIAGNGNHWNINHWVIAYGLKYYYMDGQHYQTEYIVNDGWGNNNVYITYSTGYMDGCIGFSLNS